MRPAIWTRSDSMNKGKPVASSTACATLLSATGREMRMRPRTHRLGRDTVVADERVGEDEDLASVRWVRQRLWVADHRSVEDHLAGDRFVSPKRVALHLGAILEHEPGARFVGLDCAAAKRGRGRLAERQHRGIALLEVKAHGDGAGAACRSENSGEEDFCAAGDWRRWPTPTLDLHRGAGAT